MKILIDENIDVRFKTLFKSENHHVFTVKDMNWLGIKNGKLLDLLKENLFDILITVDKNLPYQQNSAALPVSIIILNIHRNLLSSISPFYPQILQLISKPLDKRVYLLNMAK